MLTNQVKAEAVFHSIGDSLAVNFSLDFLSKRDQLNLFNALFRKLGFVEAMQTLPKETRDAAYDAMEVVSKKLWDAKD